ncbi:hypothetical protein AB3M93_11150 [Novosphingobium panipatense]|uniref:hypothetical protein n=1 Tax=Novosphingobium TaxID=165696 RepID=UPI000CDB5887|nr:hypothetical protein [Novosphingobium sp. HII-3]
MRPSFAAVGFLALAAAPLAAIPLVVPTGTAYAEALENQPTKPDQNVGTPEAATPKPPLS